MDKEFKTTFIPKKQLSKVRNTNIRSKKKNSLLFLLAVLLFITALISIAGVYAYKFNVSSGLKNKIDSINTAEKAFEPTVILELKKLDIRLRAATDLLDKHTALSDFFDSFGESTLPSLSFSEFSFTYNEVSSEITMTGESKGYLPIAQQSDLFEKNQYIQNHIFSDFELSDDGMVIFSLGFSLNPELTYYGRKVKNTQTDTVIGDGVIIDSQTDTLPAGQNVDYNNPFNN
ncbi:MAG: hypothetical protein LR005_01840 [Candidatus Pacebacteria bacterium]|nr:hypothetical protein [Candidatus Paceibacterota bacterium]